MVVFASRMSFLFVILIGLSCSYLSHAHNHVVYEWMLKPTEEHSHWAQKQRFQINDEIVFEYTKGVDSVHVVGEDDYKNCKKDKPIETLTDGYSIFKFDRSGLFFFISGHDQNCEKGEKMIIYVMSDHHLRRNNAPSPPHDVNTHTLSKPSPPPAVSRDAPPPEAKDHAHPPVYMTLHHAPAPAPSSASALGGSFILTVGLSVVAIVISFVINA